MTVPDPTSLYRVLDGIYAGDLLLAAVADFDLFPWLGTGARRAPPELLDHDTRVDADKRGPLPFAEYSSLHVHSTPGKCWSVAGDGLEEYTNWQSLTPNKVSDSV